MLWSMLVDAIRVSLFAVAHWFGGSLGAAILVSSMAVRVAMIPLTIRATRRALAMPTRSATAAKLPQMDGRSLLSNAVQLTVVAAFYSAIRALSEKAGRFLWVADLGKPDRLLAMLAACIAAAVTWLVAASGDAKAVAQVTPIVITSVLTFLFLTHMSAGLALYSVANSVVTVAERRLAARRPAERR